MARACCLDDSEGVKAYVAEASALIEEGFDYVCDVEGGNDVLYIFNHNLEEGQAESFQKFIKKEKTLVKHAPKRWKYLGTYFYVLGFGPYSAADLWECSASF